ncbi:MAG: hypothetical protein KKB51_16880 [Candidatus Riflebacteria bacterium]|nr:hypothetical protein [Candidatus Riflebacteria bacterium]
MDSKVWIIVPILLFSLFFITKCGKSLGIEYSSGVQGEIEVVDLPLPKAPSKVFGIGDAMDKGQDVLLFRQTRKSSSLPLNERNFFFITKLMESYAPEVKVIELPNTVSYPQGDFYSDLMDNFPGNGYGVIRKEGDGYKLYRSTFGYSEEYEKIVVPVKESIEQVLGPSRFDKDKLISKQSKYEGYSKAMREGRSMILYSFANACGNFPLAEQKSLEKNLKSRFSGDAEIILINHKSYIDPANELYSKCQNIVCVYNKYTRKTYPALFTGSDVLANVRKFLDER